MAQVIYKGKKAVFAAATKMPQGVVEIGKSLDATHTLFKKPRRSNSGQTVFFEKPVHILAGGSVVANREGEGPVGNFFDNVIADHDKEKNFEHAEIRMLKESILHAVQKSGLLLSDIDMLLSGDLLNQITTSNYVARDLGLPYIGLYSACSTMSQALAIGGCFLNAGYFDHVACATVSHFATAERQYRHPLEYGAQRPPYAQWTVTGAGCTVLARDVKATTGSGVRLTSATFGKVVDMGITDVANMGAAMAPAALDTLLALLDDTGYRPEEFDLILTGDLGKLGSDVLRELAAEQGYTLGQNYTDCGTLIYDNTQKCYQGGSGAGCSASVFNSYILDRMQEGYYKRVAFLATGALMSPQSCYQGESIPCISHAVVVER